MIILTDVAAKLSEILNSGDCPVPFKFVVKSQGYHLDSIANHKTGENQIPVFLTIVGGEYNPVPNLHETNFTYGVTIWFPVRFKEDFYALNEYLEETFVGKKLQIGDKVALCNISVAEYGEITGLHLDQFEQWLEETYEDNVHIFKKEHDISEEYMSMEFRLFCTTLGDGFMFGNDVKYELTAIFPYYTLNAFRVYKTISHSWYDYTRYETGDDVSNEKYCYKNSYNALIFIDVSPTKFTKLVKKQFNVYTYADSQYTKIEDAEIQNMVFNDITHLLNQITTELVWTNSGNGVSISPVAQQLIGDSFAKNITNIVNFNKSTVIYPQDNDFWDYFLYVYNTQNMQGIKSLTLTKKYANGMEYKFNQLVLSANENVVLGEPLSFTLTYGDKK